MTFMLATQKDPQVQLAEEEIAALRQQHIILKDLCQKERAQNERLQQQIERLTDALQEKDRCYADLQQEQQKKSSQIEHEAAIAEERAAFQAVQTEKEELQRSVTEFQEQRKQFERVIKFLRERGEESHLEAKQLREEFQELQNKLTAMSEQLQSANEEIKNSKCTIGEKEHGIKLAQQYLAKKMKEAAVYSEKNQELRAQIIELQKALTDSQVKMTAMQNNLEAQLMHQKQLQEQHYETLRGFEAQASKWENKYFTMYDKWQEAEGQNKAFKLLEEKHNQILVLLGNLNSIVKMSGKSGEQLSDTPELDLQQKFVDAPPPIRYKQTLFD